MLTETRNPTLLLVEDSEDDAFFFERALHKSGMSCALNHVTNGAQAIEFLRGALSSGENNFPHMVFLDLKMPVLNGFEVLDWIKHQVFPVPLHVVVLSGSEHTGDKERAASLGAEDYLIKPIRPGDLHRVLQHICAQEMGARV